jgi:(p)ppGpp synthase/HD superfamily hydrolase
MKTNIHLWSYLAQFFAEWENFLTKIVEKINTNFDVQGRFFEIYAVYEIMWKKYCRTRQATDGSMARVHFTLST